MHDQHKLATRLDRRTAVLAIAFTFGYAVLALFGLQWAALGGAGAPLFPAAGIALAGLLRWGARFWPAVFAGMMLAFLADGRLPLSLGLLVSGGNAAVAAAGVLLLRRIGFDLRLSRLRDMVALTALAVGAPTLQAALGTSIVSALYGDALPHVGVVWLSWWAGDAGGVLLVVPLVLSWSRPEPVQELRSFCIRVALTGGLSAAIAWLVLASPALLLPLAWVVFPPLIWAALATGVRGTSLALWPPVAIALGAAASENGPLAERTQLDPTVRLVIVQAFVTVTAATVLMLAVAAEERQRDAAARRASEQRLALALETGQLGFWDWDVPSGRALYGGSWGAQLGHDLADLEPHVRAWETRVHPDDLERATRALRDHLESRTELYECAHRLRHKDGTWRWILARGRVVERDAAGRPLRAIGTHSDVTAFKEAEQRKDEFLATLAHELRNPLAPIRNGLAVLHHTRSPEMIDRMVAMMDRQLCHLVVLVDDLLDVSRLSRGKVPLRKERVTVAEVVDAAVEACRPSIEAKQHTLETHLPGEPIAVYGDRIRLVQILSNLLTNAGKYTDPGGLVTVTAERDGATVRIRVEDTGAGMTPEVLPTIWDMFTQIRDTLDKAQGGLGIGLTLVKRLVEMHGGTVSAASEGPGRGSTFTVRLPVLSE